MAVLNKAQRRELKNAVSVFRKESDSMYYEIVLMNLSPRILLLRKYRLCLCIKLLQRFGIIVNLNHSLPDTDEILLGRIAQKEDPSSWYDLVQKTIDDYSALANEFLERVLKNTNWEIYQCVDLTDYEKIPTPTLNHFRTEVENHWGMMSAANVYLANQCYRIKSEKLEGLGFKADDHTGLEFLPTLSVILVNPKIEKMISMRETVGEEYKELYEELKTVSSFYLFDAFIAGGWEDLTGNNWKGIFYLFGEDPSYNEYTDMYIMNYEAVIYLLLADMIAEEFFKNRQEENK